MEPPVKLDDYDESCLQSIWGFGSYGQAGTSFKFELEKLEIRKTHRFARFLESRRILQSYYPRSRRTDQVVAFSLEDFRCCSVPLTQSENSRRQDSWPCHSLPCALPWPNARNLAPAKHHVCFNHLISDLAIDGGDIVQTLPRTAYDKDATVAHAKALINVFGKHGISRRVEQSSSLFRRHTDGAFRRDRVCILYSAGSRESHEATLSISSLDEPKAWVDVYYPVLNSPLDRSLEILGDDGNPVWSAELEEVTDETDPYAFKSANAIPTWHGISRGGQAEGKLTYAHYGRQKDFDALVEACIDFNGKIVLARYGGVFRGLKIKRAQELGAAAVLVYSDPRDDGTVTVENGYVPYPHGPARNPTSVQFLSLYPGDPSTPGYPSYENSTRLRVEANRPSRDGHEGVTVRLVNNGEIAFNFPSPDPSPFVVDEKVTPIWNVMGVIPGDVKGEVVVIGAHRDAWVTGASDPSSGNVSLLEVIRGFGVLLKKGWKPLRTILITSWDGEEFGLVGSTEWGEDFPEWIKDHVVAYINMGSRLKATGSPLLAHLLRETAEQIPHPTSEGRSLWDARGDSGTLFGEHINAGIAAMHEDEPLAADSIGVSPLGSGSDYTIFLQYHGVSEVPSTDGGFTSTLHDPVYHYHSIFDSQYWQELYGDPGFSRHVAIAKHTGLQVLRLSGDIILPFNTTHYSKLESYLDKVVSIAVAGSFDVDLSPLRGSLHSLQNASLELDFAKTKAVRKLREILKALKRRHAICHKIRRKIHKASCKLKKVFGQHECESNDKHKGMEREPHRRVF
ncbi:hypothetical protein EDD22DRAFT_985405 [Suillus occidentalis]|nr:hypothetical protein EDD22DRAFT_985405 [Suillus occidentalis]